MQTATITPVQAQNPANPRTAAPVERYSVVLNGYWIGTYTTMDSAKNFATSGSEGSWTWTTDGFGTVHGRSR